MLTLLAGTRAEAWEAAEGKIDVVRRDKFEAGPAFKMEGWCGRLVEFGFGFGNFGERDGCVARLEGDFAVATEVFVAVEDMFEVQAGDGENGARVCAVNQAMDAVCRRDGFRRIRCRQ